jgi:hypothetical protein
MSISPWTTHVFDNLGCSSLHLFHIAHVALVVGYALLLSLVLVHLLDVQHSDICIPHAVSLCEQATQSLSTACDNNDLFSQIHLSR